MLCGDFKPHLWGKVSKIPAHDLIPSLSLSLYLPSNVPHFLSLISPSHHPILNHLCQVIVIIVIVITIVITIIISIVISIVIVIIIVVIIVVGVFIIITSF